MALVANILIDGVEKLSAAHQFFTSNIVSYNIRKCGAFFKNLPTCSFKIGAY